MGSLLFDFLNDSVLFDDGRLDTHFSGVDDNRLTRELVGYRDHVLSRMADIIDESRAEEGKLAVLGNAQLSTVSELTKAAFYFDTVIVTDPLFSQTPPPPEVAKFAIGMSDAYTPWQLDRERIAAAATLMKNLRFAMATGYVHFMPDLRGHVEYKPWHAGPRMLMQATVQVRYQVIGPVSNAHDDASFVVTRANLVAVLCQSVAPVKDAAFMTQTLRSRTNRRAASGSTAQRSPAHRPPRVRGVTSRPLARPSVRRGSQPSIVPTKCWKNTRGVPPGLPKRR